MMESSCSDPQIPLQAFMDVQGVINQLAYPVKNFTSIFFAVLIALLVERFMKEFEDADIIKICKHPRNVFGHLSNFLIRFLVAFFVVFIIVLLIIAIAIIVSEII